MVISFRFIHGYSVLISLIHGYRTCQYTGIEYNLDMKQNYTITVDSAVWQRLEDIAEQGGFVYRGRPSRSAVIESLVTAPAPPPPPPAPMPVQPEPSQTPAVVAPQQWRLADIVAKWPDKVQQQWQQDGWKAKRWVEQVLETINAGR